MDSAGFPRAQGVSTMQANKQGISATVRCLQEVIRIVKETSLHISDSLQTLLDGALLCGNAHP
jgi:hypothetical protein